MALRHNCNLAILDCLKRRAGQLGTVTGFKFQQNNPNPVVVYVKFDARKDGISTIRQSNDSTACATNAVPITTTLSTIKMCSRKHSSPQIERTQLPLCLAWACTIQVQGLTLDKLVISFELHRQKSFNPGQIYLALSRVKSIEGLFILGNFD